MSVGPGGAFASIMRPMEITDIIHELASCEELPRAALRAGSRQVDELRERLYGLAEKFIDGVHLLPPDSQLLFYGLHILVASRDKQLFELLMRMALLPETAIEELLGDIGPITLARFYITSFEQEDEPTLFALLENQKANSTSRQAAFMALARLTFDKRIDRLRTTGFVSRFEREALADERDNIWFGWVDIVILLGLVDLEEALKRVWEKDYFTHFREIDRADAHERLHEAAENPDDEQHFINDQLTAIDDVIEALSWIERISAYRREQEAKDKAGASDKGQIRETKLSSDEFSWLSTLLSSQQAPAGCMDMEMLDGFFTALVLSPDRAPPAQFMPIIWDPENQTNEIEYDNNKQAEYAVSLLIKYQDEIAARLQDSGTYIPLVGNRELENCAQGWAIGFINAMTLQAQIWRPLMGDPKYGILTASVMALVSEELNRFDEPLTPDIRARLIDDLPVTISAIRAFWRGEPITLPGSKKHPPAHNKPASNEPVRSQKVGRNQPCPCGSGKKHKHCCGKI